MHATSNDLESVPLTSTSVNQPAEELDENTGQISSTFISVTVHERSDDEINDDAAASSDADGYDVFNDDRSEESRRPQRDEALPNETNDDRDPVNITCTADNRFSVSSYSVAAVADLPEQTDNVEDRTAPRHQSSSSSSVDHYSQARQLETSTRAASSGQDSSSYRSGVSTTRCFQLDPDEFDMPAAPLELNRQIEYVIRNGN